MKFLYCNAPRLPCPLGPARSHPRFVSPLLSSSPSRYPRSQPKPLLSLAIPRPRTPPSPSTMHLFRRRRGTDLPLPPRPPPPLWDAAMSRLDSGIAARSDVSDRNGADPVDLDLEPSFARNLFPGGYSIGEPSKGMLLFLIGDDPEEHPCNRASKALLSVREYRSFLSNGGDSSGDDFPKVNRVALRLGIECVLKGPSSIVDASCTYHDQLVSTFVNPQQTRFLSLSSSMPCN